MRYAKIEDNIVVNVEELDPNDIPEGTYVQTDIAGHRWNYDGQNFTKPPPPTQAEIAELHDALAAAKFTSAKSDRAMGELLWQIAKAAKTDNWSFFDNANGGAGVNNRADFVSVYREILDQVS